MTIEETKFCEECRNCKLIEYSYVSYWVHCGKRLHDIFNDAVIYCKYKKLKKEKKKKC